MDKRTIKIVSLVMLAALILCILPGCSNAEKDAAVKDFEEQSARISKQMDLIDEEIAEAERMLAEDKPATDESIEVKLREKVEEAKALDVAIPDMPDEVEEIKVATAELEALELGKIFMKEYFRRLCR